MSTKSSQSLKMRRKAAHLCEDCGKPLDRDGAFCNACLEKHRKYYRDRKDALLARGVCPICGKYKLYGDEKTCPECRAKNTEATARCRNNHKMRYNKYMSQYRQQMTVDRATKGICTRCGKPKDDDGFKMCPRCRQKSRKKWHRLNDKPVKQNERYKIGRCRFCDQPVKEGYKVCEYHYQKLLDMSAKGNQTDKAKKWKKEIGNWTFVGKGVADNER